METIELIIPEEWQHLYSSPSKVVRWPDPRLRNVARKVTKFNKALYNRADAMRKVMMANGGVGLAAPQLGIDKQIIVVKEGVGLPTVMINPIVTQEEGEILSSSEGCLSLPKLRGDVVRSNFVNFSYRDLQNKLYHMTTGGYGAIVLLHEIDHLNGILFVDKAVPGSLKWSTRN